MPFQVHHAEAIGYGSVINFICKPFCFFSRFCAEVDKFLSPILLIYILIYEFMICVPLYQLVLVRKNPQFSPQSQIVTQLSLPISPNSMEQDPTARASFVDCQEFIPYCSYYTN